MVLFCYPEMRWNIEEPKTVRNSSDWEYGILCDRNFFWNGPTAAFDKKADTAGNRTGKYSKLAEKTAQQMAEKCLETWYNHRKALVPLQDLCEKQQSLYDARNLVGRITADCYGRYSNLFAGYIDARLDMYLDMLQD